MCFAETKLDDSANPVAPNIPGDLSGAREDEYGVD